MVKRIRQEGHPVRPITGFIRFMNEKRPEYVEKIRNEGTTGSIVTQVSKLAKEEWDSISVEQRLVWNGPAAEEIAKYNIAVAEFKKENPPPVPVKEEKVVKKIKKNRAPGTPAKTATSYILFSVSERTNTIAELNADGVDINFTTIAKRTAEKWKTLSAENRSPWDTRAKQLAAAAKVKASEELAEMQTTTTDSTTDVDNSTDTNPKRKYTKRVRTELVTDPVSETTDPVSETTDPVSETTDPVSETTDPVSETTDPVSETTDQVDNVSVKMDTDAVEQPAVNNDAPPKPKKRKVANKK